MKLLDLVKKVQVECNFVDSRDDTTSVEEAYELIQSFLEESLSDEEDNPCKNQVYPLLAEMTSTILEEAIKDASDSTKLMLSSSPMLRFLMIRAIMVGFFTYHLMHEKNYSINVNEEELSQEEVNDIRKHQSIIEATLSGMMSGQTPTEVFQGLYDDGVLTNEDIESYELQEFVQINEQQKNKDN